MWRWLPVPLLYATLALLLRAEERTPRDERQVYLWKPLATVWVILACALSFTLPSDRYDTTYSWLVLAGLVLSLVGDVMLIPQHNPRAFLIGLVAFLVAHLTYISAFIHLQTLFAAGTSARGEAFSAVGLVLVGALVYRYLRPGLGRMRRPVVAYIFVISVMVHRALAIAWVHPGPVTQPALIALGALLFYVSDAILAINRFRLKGQMAHYKVWNLSTYYSGQLLIALSTWFL